MPSPSGYLESRLRAELRRPRLGGAIETECVSAALTRILDSPWRFVELRVTMELRHLRYFLAVVDELHFGHAAARLHIAQPPLSQAIRKLETELGVELLHRTSRVVAPTNAGRVFAKEARKVLAAVNIAVAEARRAGGVDAPIRIGCMPYFPIEQLRGPLAASGADR